MTPKTLLSLRQVLAASFLFVPLSADAQQDPLAKAFDLERRGSYAAAADAYRGVLATRPGEVSALLGLERSLIPLNRLPELLPAVRVALGAIPNSSSPALGAIYAAGVRAWAALDQPDSLRQFVERWARAIPNDETPYREWGAALLIRDRSAARQAYEIGRQRLGRTDVLAAEMAQLAVLEQDYLSAVREWLVAIKRLPGYRQSAVGALALTPWKTRPEVLRQLEREATPHALRLAADLSVRWGDPMGGVRRLTASLGADRKDASEALRQFLESLRNTRTKDALQAQGMVLEGLAQRSTSTQAQKYRLEAARVYAEAGDREAARRMLSGLADDRAAPSGNSAGATATLINILIDEGSVEEAERRLREARANLSAEERENLGRLVAAGWMRRGKLDRAQTALAADSSVEGVALAGRIKLYRGDLKGARQALQLAGPFAGTRDEATARAVLLALLQPIAEDSLPALGEAMFQIERGDTAAAVIGLEKVAAGLEPQAGGAEILLLAARLQASRSAHAEAERLFRAAAVESAPAAAAAAELELGRLLIGLERKEEAITVLEHLVLKHPQSALVPQARRMIDIARGAVPRT